MIKGIRANELLPQSLLHASLHSFAPTGIDTEEDPRINFDNDAQLLTSFLAEICQGSMSFTFITV